MDSLDLRLTPLDAVKIDADEVRRLVNPLLQAPLVNDLPGHPPGRPVPPQDLCGCHPGAKEARVGRPRRLGRDRLGKDSGKEQGE
jgi:hypothetical protein